MKIRNKKKRKFPDKNIEYNNAYSINGEKHCNNIDSRATNG